MANYRKTTRNVPRRRATLDEPVTVGQFHRNRRGETVRVSLSTFENHNLVDIRVFFTGKDGLPQPSKKGLAINVLRLPDLLAALTRAQKQAAELGLCEPGAA